MDKPEDKQSENSAVPKGKNSKKSAVIINPPEKGPLVNVNELFKSAIEKHTVAINNKTSIVLEAKATQAGLDADVVERVFVRGYKNLPLNSTLTREQYAMNRVNSFIAGGAAMEEDCDLLPIVERIGLKGTGGAMRPHIKRERSPYNNKITYHVVDSRGIIKHSTSDEFEARKHLAQKYRTYMEGVLSPMKRLIGTNSLVRVYKKDTPGQHGDTVNEDLRKWFNDRWVRMDTQGNIKGDCAREPGEGKPKCLPAAKAHAMDKEDRASAAQRKRREDPVADRPGKGGAPINVRTEEKQTSELIKQSHSKRGAPGTLKAKIDGPITLAKAKALKNRPDATTLDKKQANFFINMHSEEVENLEEKNSPTNPALWSRAKSLARSKFDVYPSAYANGWAAKWYKSKGGSWKSVGEEVELPDDITSKLKKVTKQLDNSTKTHHKQSVLIKKLVAKDEKDVREDVTEAKKKFGYDAINARFKELTGSSLEDRAKHYDELTAKLKKQEAEYKAQQSKSVKEETEDLNERFKTAAWSRKEGKNPEGGLNRRGIASYRAQNPGSKLSMAVTTKPSKLDPDSKAAKRRKSFCARMSGVEGPMKKPNGEPTRKALALRKWNC